jgi:Ca2+-binding RTX toxin-like protein
VTVAFASPTATVTLSANNDKTTISDAATAGDIAISNVSPPAPAGCVADTSISPHGVDCPATAVHVGASGTPNSLAVTLSGLTRASATVALGSGTGEKLTASGALTQPFTYTADPASTGTNTVDLSGVTGSLPTVHITTVGSGNDVQLPSTEGDLTVDMGAGPNNTLDFSSDTTDTSPVTFTYSGARALQTNGGTGGGFSGVDTLKGTGGTINDNFVADQAGANETLDGGAGTNTLDLHNASAGVTVDLTTHKATTPVTSPGSFSISSNFQHAMGSSAGGNTLIAGTGNETLDGGGGTGNKVQFAPLEAAINAGEMIDLQHCTATACLPMTQQGTATSTSGVVTMQNIQEIDGGNKGDTVTMPAAGSFDVALGSGTNTLDFSHDPTGTTFSFSAPTTLQVAAPAATYTNVEHVIGTGGDDEFDPVGASASDTVDGGPGSNTVNFSSAGSGVTVNQVTGSVTGGQTVTISNFQHVIGSIAGSNTFIPCVCNDTLDGGGGTGNEVNFSGFATGVTINLSTGSATDGTHTVTLAHIDHVVGSSAGGNTLIAGTGNETLDGGGGTGNKVQFSDLESHTGSGETIDLHNCSASACTPSGKGIANSAAGTVTMQNIQEVDGGDKGDTVKMPAAGAFNVVLGTGSNTLDFSARSTATTFSFPAATTLAVSSPAGTYAHVENVIGTAGNDTFDAGGAGSSETLDGGGGTNTLDLSSDSTGVTVNLVSGHVTGGQTLSITNFEHVIASSHGGNTFVPCFCNDTLDGGGGTDNEVNYSGFAAGATIDLAAGTESDGGQTDTLANIDHVIGSSAGGNTLIAGTGNELLDGGTGGANKVQFSALDTHNGAGETIDLGSCTATACTPAAKGTATSAAGTVTMQNVQEVDGGSKGDTVKMPAAGTFNVVLGSGNNTLDFSADPTGTTFSFPAATTLAVASPAGTYSNVENVIGTAGDDVFAAGGAGPSETLDGGPGTNTLNLSGASAAVTVNLVTGKVTGAQTLTISRFQDVIGSSVGGNTLIAGPGDEVLDGGTGGGNRVQFSALDSHNNAGETIDLSSCTATECTPAAKGTASSSSGIVTMQNIQEVDGGNKGDTVKMPAAGVFPLALGTGANTLSFAAVPTGTTFSFAGPTTVQVASPAGTYSPVATVIGTGGNDEFDAGGAAASETLDGGPGTNTLNLSSAGSGVNVNLVTGAVTGGQTLSIANFQHVIGSTAGGNTFTPCVCNATLDGGGGTNNEVDYSAFTSAVTVNLISKTETENGTAQTDNLLHIDHVIGSSVGGNTLIAGSGNELLDGGTGGGNTVDFGPLEVMNGTGMLIDLTHCTAAACTPAAQGTATSPSGTVTLQGIQQVKGGNDGDSVGMPAAGKFALQLGTGTNTLDFSADSTGTTFSFPAPTTLQLASPAGTYANVQSVIGTSGNDVFNAVGTSDTLDAGPGTNTLTLFGASAGVNVNLVTGTVSGAESLSIANFQKVIGSTHGGNTFIPCECNATLDGGGATNNEVDYSGFSKPVTVNLSTGTETENTTAQNDTLFNIDHVVGSSVGSNTLIAGSTDELLDGGAGPGNTVDFTAADVANNNTLIDLTHCSATACQPAPKQGKATPPSGNTITFQNIQTVQGGPGNDDVEMPAAGAFDVLFGGGATQRNELDFSADPTGTTFSFTAPTTLKVASPAGTYANVQIVAGTTGDDTFNGANTTDTLNGGPGTNTLSYASLGSGKNVNVDLLAGTAQSPAGTAQISNFQNVTGGGGDDTLLGDCHNNTLIGGGGNNTIDGRCGNNYIVGGPGTNMLEGGTGTNLIVGGPGNNTVTYADRTEPITIDLTGKADSGAASENDTIVDVQNAIAGSGDTTLIGSAANNTLQGGSGNDTFIPGPANATIIGGSGTSTVSYANRPIDDPLTVDLGAGVESDGTQTDQLTNIHSVIGGAGDDTLIAGTGDDTLTAGPGNSTLIGGAGNDTLNTGSGNDYVEAGSGPDTINTGTGTSVVWTRNGAANTINCGDGTTTVYAASVDTANNCQNVVLVPPMLAGNVNPNVPIATAHPMIAATLVAGFKRAKHGTRVTKLQVLGATANTSIVATCHGKGCSSEFFPEFVHLFTANSGPYDMRELFGDVSVPRKTKLVVSLLQPNTIGRIYTYVFQRKGPPTMTLNCQDFNTQKAAPCS